MDGFPYDARLGVRVLLRTPVLAARARASPASPPPCRSSKRLTSAGSCNVSSSSNELLATSSRRQLSGAVVLSSARPSGYHGLEAAVARLRRLRGAGIGGARRLLNVRPAVFTRSGHL